MRNTLAWSRCAVCGRKTAVFECRVGGRRLELCLFCISTLALYGKARCPEAVLSIKVPRALQPVAETAREEPDERLIEALRKATGQKAS
ncbi:MAG: hypothetical protein F7C07_03130 [Desulfurococcales archaeon]|nr:hypothetical protein [Desulfurococcales archaeon]